MSLAATVAWALFALLIGWVGVVVYATLRQLERESRKAARRRR